MQRRCGGILSFGISLFPEGHIPLLSQLIPYLINFLRACAVLQHLKHTLQIFQFPEAFFQLLAGIEVGAFGFGVLPVIFLCVLLGSQVFIQRDFHIFSFFAVIVLQGHAFGIFRYAVDIGCDQFAKKPELFPVGDISQSILLYCNLLVASVNAVIKHFDDIGFFLLEMLDSVLCGVIHVQNLTH